MKISVITVCYNAEATIEHTLRSVRMQDWPDYEHIVIDGASTDGTMAVVERMRHDRLIAISEPDAGVYDAMNKGLARAQGTYSGFLNADDFFASTAALRNLAQAAIDTGADCVFGDTQFVDFAGKPRGRLYSTSGFRRWWLRGGFQPPHPSFYARTDLLRAAGGFDMRFTIAADFDLIARLIIGNASSWHRIPGTIACFRPGGLSTSGVKVKRTIDREISESLRLLGQPFPRLSAQFRYLPKLIHWLAGKRLMERDQV